MEKKLTKSKNKLILGICAGVAEHLNMDPTLVRVLWVVVTLLAGVGVLAYVICIFIMPDPDGGNSVIDSLQKKSNDSNDNQSE